MMGSETGENLKKYFAGNTTYRDHRQLTPITNHLFINSIIYFYEKLTILYATLEKISRKSYVGAKMANII